VTAPPTYPDAGPLDQTHLDDYACLGWCVARAFYPPAEAAAIARWTQEVTALPEVTGRQMVYHETSLVEHETALIQRIENFCPYHPDFDRAVREGRLIWAVEQLFGEAAVLFKDKINFKMPGGSGFAPHQDQQAGWSAFAPLFVTALVCIDRATPANGCLDMAYAPRLRGMIGREWTPLAAEDLVTFTLLPVPAEPGDVVFFDSYVPHASKPNLTDQPRRALYLTYNRASDGDYRDRYFVEKRAAFPPDVEREAGVAYQFRV